MNIAKRLHLLRTQAGLSQNQLSKMSDVAQSIISLTESGEREPSISVLLRLCRAMGITLTDFFEEDTEPVLKPKIQRLTELCALLEDEEIDALYSVASALTKAHEKNDQ